MFSQKVDIAPGERKTVYFRSPAGPIEVSGHALFQERELTNIEFALAPLFSSEMDKIYFRTDEWGLYQIRNLQPGRYEAHRTDRGRNQTFPFEIQESGVLDLHFQEIFEE